MAFPLANSYLAFKFLHATPSRKPFLAPPSWSQALLLCASHGNTYHMILLLPIIHLLLDVSAWFIILAPEARIVTIETFTNLLNELDFKIHKTQTELNYIILKEFNFKNKNKHLSPSFQMIY